MKPPIKAPLKKLTKEDRADLLGAMYEGGKAIVEEGQLQCDEAKNLTLALAGAADPDKAEGYVKGKKFTVGFFTRTGSPSFDAELFKDLYPKLFAKCLVTKTVFDEERLQMLVKKKIVKQSEFNAAVVRPRGSRVIDIKRL